MRHASSGRPARPRRDLCRFAALPRASLLACALAAPSASRAEVSTDGTLGPRTTLPGPDVEIGADLGQVRGTNLFHSFQRFDVETGGSATFTGPSGLANVVARVTGGERSDIDGALRSTIPGADLYLLNPAGVVFGPNATLDLGGAFHASTAGELRFSDGAAFSALDPSGSTLSVAEPQAFGFLGGPAASVAVNGSTLEVPPGEALSLTGGEVAVEAGTLRNRFDLLGAGGSSVVIAAQQAAGTVPVSPDSPAVARDGPVRIASSEAGVASNVLVSGFGGGRVRIEGGEVVLDGGTVSTVNLGDVDDAGGVELAARTLAVQTRAVVGGQAGGVLTTTLLGTGRAGPVRVTASDVNMSGGALASSPAGPGGGGAVAVTADRLTMSGGVIGAPILPIPGAGASAPTVVDVSEALTLSEGATIASTSFGDGAAGPIFVRSGGTMALSGGSTVSAEASGAGAAGAIVVEAGDLTISGAGAPTFTGIASSALPGSTGAAGSVGVTADSVSIARQDAADRAGIASDTSGPGPAGAVTVVANERLEVRDGGVVSSSTFADGAAGTVTVFAGALLIDADGFDQFATGILSQAEPGSSGPAGLVTIVADDLQVRGGGEIASSTFGPGAAGTVQVIAGNLLVSSDGFRPFITGIASQADFGSSGAAGIVAVLVTGGQAEVRGASAQITSKSLGSGNAGGVGVIAPRVLVRDDGSITSESANGQAGVALVQADELTVEDATIRTSSGGFAGGLIQVDADDRIYLRDAEVTTNGVVPSAGASLITLQAREIILNRSRVTSLTGDGQPLAGSGEARLLGDLTVISADSLVAGSSTVQIEGLQNNIGSGLQLSPGAFLDVGRLLRESCAAAAAGAAPSSFTRAGRGGLPPAPDRPLASLGAAPDEAAAGVQELAAAPVFLDACGGKRS